MHLEGQEQMTADLSEQDGKVNKGVLSIFYVLGV